MFIQKLGKRVVYLDHIATTPVAQEVIDQCYPTLGNTLAIPPLCTALDKLPKRL
jgi:cysteine desulfurase